MTTATKTTLLLSGGVIAVLFALLTGMNESRVGALEEGAEAIAVLARLHQDLSAERRQLESRADTAAMLDAFTVHIIDWADEIERSSSLRLIEELALLSGFSPREPVRVGYDALSLSGDLARLRDGRIRGALVEYYRGAERLRDLEHALPEALDRALDAHLPRGVWHEVRGFEDPNPQPVDYRAALAILDQEGIEVPLRTTRRALARYRNELSAQIARAAELIELLESARAAL